MPDAHESCRKAPSQPHKCSRFIVYSRGRPKSARGKIWERRKVYEVGSGVVSRLGRFLDFAGPERNPPLGIRLRPGSFPAELQLICKPVQRVEREFNSKTTVAFTLILGFVRG